MATKEQGSRFTGGERELVVIFKPEVGLRAARGEAVGEARPRVRMRRAGKGQEGSDKDEARKEMKGKARG